MTSANRDRPPCLIYHQPTVFTRKSAFPPLVERLGAQALHYDVAWERLQERSWTLGHALRRWGTWYYGSTWNALVPLRDEWRLARAARRLDPVVVHFLWGEFASPRHPGWFRSPGSILVGTFHCSARRQPSVLDGMRDIGVFDAITVVSKTQVPYFVRRGYREDQVHVIPLGVDTDYFKPPEGVRAAGSGPVKAILIGQTERDHVFTAEVMRRLPRGTVRLQIRTNESYFETYKGIDGCELLPRLSDEELVALYGAADLMIMPMLDCTANDAMLECMACGTPVMTNRIGGIPEYVDAACNFVMESKDPAAWVSAIEALARRPDSLAARRAGVRASAERFGWDLLAPQYSAFYADTLQRRN